MKEIYNDLIKTKIAGKITKNTFVFNSSTFQLILYLVYV